MLACTNTFRGHRPTFPSSASCRLLQEHVSVLSVFCILPPFPLPAPDCNSFSNLQIFGSARGAALHQDTCPKGVQKSSVASSVKTEAWRVSNQAFLGSLASGSHQQLRTASVHQDPSEEMRMLRESHSTVLLPISNEPVAVGAQRWPEIFPRFQHGGGSSSSRTKYLPCKPQGQRAQPRPSESPLNSPVSALSNSRFATHSVQPALCTSRRLGMAKLFSLHLKQHLNETASSGKYIFYG